MGKTIWIDLENSPHVPFFEPWVRWLRAAGHEVFLTARDLSQTHALLRLHDLEFVPIGGHGGGSRVRKALRIFARASGLAGAARSRHVALAMGHGARAQVLAAAWLGIPSVTFLDYEYVSLRLFGAFCRRVFFPDSASRDVLRARGIPATRLVSYPGFKEQVYLDPAVDRPHPVEPPLVLVRPPARLAHYHTPRSEVLYRHLMERLANAQGCDVLVLPRYAQDVDEVKQLGAKHPHIRVAEDAQLGRDLLLRASLVVSGGGTMVREAAVLGVPSASFFGGPVGGVDAALSRAGRLWMLRSLEDVAALPLPGSDVTPAVAGVAQGGLGKASPDPLPETARVRAFLQTEVLRFL
jgi:predicted glycosyltransferase